MSFSKRLFKLRDLYQHKDRSKPGITQQELATLLGVSRPTINLWENPPNDNTYPTEKNMEKLCSVFKCDASWLRFGGNHFQPKDYIIPIDLVQLSPIIEQRLTLKNFEIGAWLESKRNILQKGQNMSIEESKSILFPYMIEGDSMMGEYNLERNLMHGDTVIVDPACTGGIKPGDIVMVQYGGISDNYKARIYYRDGTDAYLSALNPSVKRVPIDENVRIIGKVITKYRNLN